MDADSQSSRPLFRRAVEAQAWPIEARGEV